MTKTMAMTATLATAALAGPLLSLTSIAREINADASSTWQAREAPSMFTNMTVSELKGMMGSHLSSHLLTPSGIPPQPAFDLRTAHPGCPSISTIRDQGACGSCFAVATATAFNDRECIASNGTFKDLLSTQDITSCDHSCNAIGCDSGCKGGFPGNAWKYLTTNGVPTEACDAYKLPPCHHPCGSNTTTPKCSATCDDGSPKKMVKARTSYPYFHADDLYTHLMKYGSITCGLSVYEDFPTYSGGVYQHKTGSMLGGHAVRLIGWGSDNGVDYWTVANSWNTWWGEKGYFRIVRGDGPEAAGFEEDCWAGCSLLDPNCK